MSQETTVPLIRITAVNDAPVRKDGDYVLYWMIASRRLRWNFSLQRAVEWAHELNKPLVILEAFRFDYPWSSERIHRFILDGMADNADTCANAGVTYYPYVEPTRNAGKGLLSALSKSAAVVVTDEFPCFMMPRMVMAAAEQVEVRMETVDGNGLLPLRATNQRVFQTAYSFRRFIQKTLPSHLKEMPRPNPLRRIRLPHIKEFPKSVLRRWPPAERNDGGKRVLSAMTFDSSVPPAATTGGAEAAAKCLKRFVSEYLDNYNSGRTDLNSQSTSGLSPYLHFGHISPHEVFVTVTGRANWTTDRLSKKADGRRVGWWGLDPDAEAFLDQLVVWRELGYNMAFHRQGYDQFESLPHWAQQTLKAHAMDQRPYLYSLGEFEQAETHDPLWNAAQRQLLQEGTIHNYLRMLWGKKILEWSRSPQEALKIMIELNNKYALDGRNPNSYSGIFWILGRYDRPWGPERPIFGKIRYMSSENTVRKLRVKNYIERYHSDTSLESDE